ncbi:hypothetical protein PZH42_31555, partial [Bacteroides cellulosilyticus]|nr:hypothetical protein [Bacteroides cellulosilyticus]
KASEWMEENIPLFECPQRNFDLYQIYSIFSAEGEQFEPQKQNCGPVAGAILENFPKEVEAATSIAYFVSSPLYNGSVRIDVRNIRYMSLNFPGNQ